MIKYFTVLLLLLFINVSYSQVSCSSAAEATIGENTIPSNAYEYYWYTFEMPDEGRVTISSSSSFSVRVYSNTCDFLYYEESGNGGLVSVDFEPGENVFIRWSIFNDTGLSWDLSIDPYQTGDKCAIADVAEIGINSVPVTEVSDYWFKFKMPSTSRLNISSGVGNTVAVYNNSCEARSFKGRSYEGNLLLTNLYEGDSVLVRWVTEGGGFDWNLSIDPKEEGDNCSLASDAQDGVNNLPTTDVTDYWYGYKMPTSGRLEITSTTTNDLDVYTNTCSSLVWLSSGSGSLTVPSLSANDSIFIKWEPSGGNFDWNLSSNTSQPGDNCNLAEEASLGTNSIPSSTLRSYWYKFQIPSDGKVDITSVDGQDVTLYANTCDELHYIDSGYGNISSSEFAAGDSLYIEWTYIQEGGFDWDLSISPFQTGDNCSLAESAIEGTNTITTTTHTDYWYKFQMPEEARLHLTTSVSNYVSVYSNTCEDLNSVGSGRRDVYVTSLAEGDSVYIKWSVNGAGFDWDLLIEPIQSGDNCSNAEIITAGTHTTPSTGLNYYYYSYEAEEDGKLEVDAPDNSLVSLFSGECSSLILENENYGGFNYTGVSSGDVFYIRMEVESNAYDWSIDVVPIEAGDICETSLDAVIGTNSVPNAPYWYRFIAPESNYYTISSVGLTTTDTYLRVYSECNGSLIDWSDDYENFQSQLTVNLDAGDSIKILWDDTYSSEAFDWSLSIETIEDGEVCETPATAVEGVNHLSAGVGNAFWYTFAMPTSNQKLTINSSTSSSITLFTGSCDNLDWRDSGQGNISSVIFNEGDSILIKWENYNGEDFDWNLSLESIEAGDLCDNSESAVVGTNIVPLKYSRYHWNWFVMPEEGKIQITSDGYLTAYKGGCENLQYLDAAHDNLTLANVEVGDSIFFRWDIRTASDFDWNLEILPLEPGDKCSLALEAVEGTNSIPVTQNSSIWYTYIMPRDGKLELTAEEYVDVDVYTNNCDNLNFRGDNRGSIALVNFVESDTVFIQWQTDNGGNFNWDLSIVDYSEGDLCSLPFEAQVGDNIVPETNVNNTWYRFTMPVTGQLEISNVNQYVHVYSGATCDSLSFEDNSYGNLIVEDLEAGVEIFIKLETDRGGNFIWNLSYEEYENGESCLITQEAVAGLNHAPKAPYWYEFTADSLADYTVSSVGSTTEDTYLVLYSTCDNLIESNDDFDDLQSEITIRLEDGETILINWRDRFSADAFDWTLSATQATKETQSINFADISDQEIGTEFVVLDIYASSGLPVEVEVVSGPATLSNDTLHLDNTVGTVTVKATQSGDKYYLPANQVVRTFEIMEITSLINEIDKQKLVIHPNPAKDFIEIKHLSNASRIKIFDSNGKIIFTAIKPSAELSVDIASWKSGLFYVLVESDGKISTQRFFKY